MTSPSSTGRSGRKLLTGTQLRKRRKKIEHLSEAQLIRLLLSALERIPGDETSHYRAVERLIAGR